MKIIRNFPYQILSLVGRFWPFAHGTGVLVEIPRKFFHDWPANYRFTMKNGLIFQGNLNDKLFQNLFLYREYEQLIMNNLKRMIRPGDTVLDIGANIGVISSFMGLLVGKEGKVISFEPVPFLYKQLQRTISLNNMNEYVVPVLMAVSNEVKGQTQIFVPKLSSHANSTLSSILHEDNFSFDCQVTTLDDFYNESLVSIPSLVKIDVEGAEKFVLEGAKNLLCNDRQPILIIEINNHTANSFGYKPEDIVTLLLDMNYQNFYWADDSKIIKITNYNSSLANGSIFCIPNWAILENRQPSL